MTFTLTIHADNAAFHGEDCPDSDHDCREAEAEIARILKRVAYEAEGGFRHYANRTVNAGLGGYIDDVNGNTVGQWTLAHED